MGGWYDSMASEDFSRARTREFLSRLSSFLAPGREGLLPLDEVRAIVRPGAESYEGVKAVPLDLIVGSEGRYRDFDRHFLPRHEHLRSRWMRIDTAHYEETPLPPVRLYEIGGVYFVRDGNHRVSVARLRGQAHIDADVSLLDAEVRLAPGMTLEELKREVLVAEKRRFYETTRFLELTGDADLDFSSPGRYDEIREHILVHKYYINQGQKEEISFDEALRSWYRGLYAPAVEEIESGSLLPRFPGRTRADLYVFIVRHWDELKRKYGVDLELAEAARDYDQRFGASFFERLAGALAAALGCLIEPALRRLGLSKRAGLGGKSSRTP